MYLVNVNKKIWYPGIFPDHDTPKSTIFNLLHEILHQLFDHLTSHFPNFDGLQLP